MAELSTQPKGFPKAAFLSPEIVLSPDYHPSPQRKADLENVFFNFPRGKRPQAFVRSSASVHKGKEHVELKVGSSVMLLVSKVAGKDKEPVAEFCLGISDGSVTGMRYFSQGKPQDWVGSKNIDVAEADKYISYFKPQSAVLRLLSLPFVKFGRRVASFFAV